MQRGSKCYWLYAWHVEACHPEPSISLFFYSHRFPFRVYPDPPYKRHNTRIHNMFATLFSVTLFVALAIQGVFADFTIDTPSLTQVIRLTIHDFLGCWLTCANLKLVWKCSTHLDSVKPSLQPSCSSRRWSLWRGPVCFFEPLLAHAILRSWYAALTLVNRPVSHINGTSPLLPALELSFSSRIPREMRLGVELWAKCFPLFNEGLYLTRIPDNGGS